MPRVRVPVPERAPERQAAARAPEALRQAGVRRGGGGGLRGARGQRAASRYRGFRASVVVYWTGVSPCGCVCPSWALVLTRAFVAGVASQVRAEPARGPMGTGPVRRNAAAVRLDLRTSTGTRRREGTAQVHVRYESPPPSLNL